ncbi:hypothetical protein [Streptomyces sp. NPDC002346]
MDADVPGGETERFNGGCAAQGVVAPSFGGGGFEAAQPTPGPVIWVRGVWDQGLELAGELVGASVLAVLAGCCGDRAQRSHLVVGLGQGAGGGSGFSVLPLLRSEVDGGQECPVLLLVVADAGGYVDSRVEVPALSGPVGDVAQGPV